jgi:hypothetical protein
MDGALARGRSRRVPGLALHGWPPRRRRWGAVGGGCGGGEGEGRRVMGGEVVSPRPTGGAALRGGG